jgi:hypothetical protein
VLGFSIVSPDYFNFRNETEYENGRQTFTSRFFNQTYWFGPSYARRLNQNFGVGATVYGLFNQEEFHSTFSGTFNERDFSIIEDKLDLLSNYDSDRKWFGVLAQVGASFVWRDFHAGLVLRSPTLQAWGSGVEDQQTIVGYESEHQLENDHVKFTPIRRDPFMVGLGVAMERPLLYAVAADVTYHGSDSYKDADKDQVADQEKLQQVINGAIGFEYVIHERVPLQAGFYTNFSPYEDTKVDTYGVTASAGLYHKQTTFNLGLNYAWGSGSGTMTKVVERKGQLVPVSEKADVSITTVNVMLSTSYRFGGN